MDGCVNDTIVQCHCVTIVKDVLPILVTSPRDAVVTSSDDKNNVNTEPFPVCTDMTFVAYQSTYNAL